MAIKPLASQRDAAIEQLRAHYVHNTIDVHAYEERVAHVTQAQDLAEMNTALADLQPLVLAQPEQHALALKPTSDAPLLAIFGSMERRGNWLTARQERLVTVFGSAELGLLDTPLQDGVTTLELTCVFGSVELTVPADLRVELQVSSVFGSAQDDGASQATTGPVLRVVGKCVFGSVEIHRK
jgi:hypothetical protein